MRSHGTILATPQNAPVERFKRYIVQPLNRDRLNFVQDAPQTEPLINNVHLRILPKHIEPPSEVKAKDPIKPPEPEKPKPIPQQKPQIEPKPQPHHVITYQRPLPAIQRHQLPEAPLSSNIVPVTTSLNTNPSSQIKQRSNPIMSPPPPPPPVQAPPQIIAVEPQTTLTKNERIKSPQQRPLNLDNSRPAAPPKSVVEPAILTQTIYLNQIPKPQHNEPDSQKKPVRQVIVQQRQDSSEYEKFQPPLVQVKPYELDLKRQVFQVPKSRLLKLQQTAWPQVSVKAQQLQLKSEVPKHQAPIAVHLARRDPSPPKNQEKQPTSIQNILEPPQGQNEEEEIPVYTFPRLRPLTYNRAKQNNQSP